MYETDRRRDRHRQVSARRAVEEAATRKYATDSSVGVLLDSLCLSSVKRNLRFLKVHFCISRGGGEQSTSTYEFVHAGSQL